MYNSVAGFNFIHLPDKYLILENVRIKHAYSEHFYVILLLFLVLQNEYNDIFTNEQALSQTFSS